MPARDGRGRERHGVEVLEIGRRADDRVVLERERRERERTPRQVQQVVEHRPRGGAAIGVVRPAEILEQVRRQEHVAAGRRRPLPFDQAGQRHVGVAAERRGRGVDDVDEAGADARVERLRLHQAPQQRRQLVDRNRRIAEAEVGLARALQQAADRAAGAQVALPRRTCDRRPLGGGEDRGERLELRRRRARLGQRRQRLGRAQQRGHRDERPMPARPAAAAVDLLAPARRQIDQPLAAADEQRVGQLAIRRADRVGRQRPDARHRAGVDTGIGVARRVEPQQRRREQRDARRARRIRGGERQHDVDRRRPRFGGQRQRIDRLPRHVVGAEDLARQVEIRQRPLVDERDRAVGRRRRRRRADASREGLDFVLAIAADEHDLAGRGGRRGSAPAADRPRTPPRRRRAACPGAASGSRSRAGPRWRRPSATRARRRASADRSRPATGRRRPRRGRAPRRRRSSAAWPPASSVSRRARRPCSSTRPAAASATS